MTSHSIACSVLHHEASPTSTSPVQDALAAALGAALVATARPTDMGLRKELLASAQNLLKKTDDRANNPRSAAVKKLIDVVGDPDSSNERIRRGAIATFRHISAPKGSHR